VEERVLDQVEPLGQGLEVVADLVAERVAVLRYAVELLQHREVDVGLDVAHHPRVAVPVPRPADAAGMVDDPYALHAGLAQVGAGQHPGDAAAHDDDVDLLDDRLALDPGREGVRPEASEVLVAGEVADVGPTGYEPLVPLGQVLGVDGLEVGFVASHGERV
jgi:hypothetical protein